MRRLLFAVAVAALFASAAPAPTHAQTAATEAPSFDGAGDAWAKARALADARRYDESLALIQRALRQYPNDAGLLWLEAGVTAWSGRPAEAVRLYEAWIARFPERRSDVALDLARARLDAGEVSGAIRDVERRLVEAPMNAEARRLRALALAYANRLEESAEVYRGLLAQDPSDVEARIGLARVCNWQGRHREAADRFRALLADGVQDPEVYRGLAFAEHWAGRSAKAVDPLRTLLARDARDPEAQRLARDIAAEMRPYAAADFGQSRDSDELDISTATAEYRHPIGARDAVSVHLRGDVVEDPLGRHEMTRAGVGHERQWSDLIGSHAYLWVEADGPLTGDDVWLGDGWVTVRPSDGLRFDAGVGREPVLSRQSLDLGLTVTSLNGSVDWDVTERWSLHVMHQRRFYADGNDVWQTGAGVRHRAFLLPRARVYVGAEFNHLASQFDVDNGYYDPSGYVELGPTLEAEWQPADRWTVSGALRYGYQDESGGEGDDFVAAAGRVEAPLGRSFAAVFEASHSDSRLASAGGYARDAWSIGLRTHF